MKKIGQLVSLLFVISLFVFVVQNLGDVELNFAVWNWKMTLAAPVLAGYLLGALTGKHIWHLLNSQRKQRKLERKARTAAEKAAKQKQHDKPAG